MVFTITSALCSLLGFAYPTYASFKAIESADTDDDKQWLTYWVAMAAISMVEPWLWYMPFFYELKLLILIWLIAPQTHGALKLYQHVIKPFLVQHAGKLDPVFTSTATVLKLPVTGTVAKMVEAQGPQAVNRLTNVVFNSSLSPQLAKLAQCDPENLTKILKMVLDTSASECAK